LTRPRVLRDRDWSAVTPDLAGWAFVGYEVLTFGVDAVRLVADRCERTLINLSGEFTVSAHGRSWEFGGRGTVFDNVG